MLYSSLWGATEATLYLPRASNEGSPRPRVARVESKKGNKYLSEAEPIPAHDCRWLGRLTNGSCSVFRLNTEC